MSGALLFPSQGAGAEQQAMPAWQLHGKTRSPLLVLTAQAPCSLLICALSHMRYC